MRTCLVVAAFERVDALERVLESVLRQTRAPDELIVADDGSGAAVRQLIDRFRRRARFPVQHVRQEHAGFRAGRARNLAIASTQCDYVVLVDGDMLLHHEFIADHVRAARRGCWTQGVRIPLDVGATRRALQTGLAPAPWGRGVDLLRRVYAVHAPPLVGGHPDARGSVDVASPAT